MDRRARWIAAAALVSLLTSTAVLLQHQPPGGADAIRLADDEPSPSAAPPPGRELWTGTATLLDTPDAELTLCGGMLLTSLPPAGCGGAVVRNFDPMTVPGAYKHEGGTITTPSVRLVGTWDGRALTVTEPFELAEPSPPPAYPPIPGPSCPEPPGGWPHDRADRNGWHRAIEYARSQSDSGEPRVDDSQRILTLPFTGDLDRHRAAVADLYDGPVCVEEVAHSNQELRQVFDRVQADLKARGLQMLGGSGGGSAQPFVDVSVIAISPEQQADLEAAYDGLLRVDSFLKRLDAPSPT